MLSHQCDSPPFFIYSVSERVPTDRFEIGIISFLLGLLQMVVYLRICLTLCRTLLYDESLIFVYYLTYLYWCTS